MRTLRISEHLGNVRIDRTFVGYLACCLLVVGLTAAPARAATLEVIPSETQLTAGQVLTVDVFVSGLGNGVPPSVGSYDLTLGFDPAILAYTGATVGTALGDPGLGEAIVGITPGAGDVNVFEVSLLPSNQLNTNQADRFRLFSVSFDTVAIGTTTLGLTVNALGDESGNPEPVDNTIVPTVFVSSTGNPISIPALSPLGLLLLAGLLLAFGWRRSR